MQFEKELNEKRKRMKRRKRKKNMRKRRVQLRGIVRKDPGELEEEEEQEERKEYPTTKGSESKSKVSNMQ